MRKSLLAASFLAAGSLLGSGCGPSVPQQQIQIKVVTSPIDEAKTMLKQYINGQPMGSEAAGFDNLVERATQQDAAKGALLKKGLEELKKAGPALPAKAKELSEKL